MANKTNTAKQKNVFAAMIVELNSQTAKQAQMQQELKNMQFKLEQTSKTIAQKDLLIDSLQVDLEHMIELIAIKNSRTQTESSQWISRPLPKLSHQEAIAQM